MVAGKGEKGASILVGAILVGSLNLLFVVAFAAFDPDPGSTWAYWILRIGHDLVAVWSAAFWLWVCFDAYREARRV